MFFGLVSAVLLIVLDGVGLSREMILVSRWTLMGGGKGIFLTI